MIESRLGPAREVRLLRLVTSGRLRRFDLAAVDNEGTIALISTSADLGLGFVEASLVASGERLSITTIAPLNNRDLGGG